MAIDNIRAIYFPYCIQKQKDGAWVLLNRNYKPVGFNVSNFMDYSEHPVSIRLIGLGSGTLKKLSYDGSGGDMVYLYNDGCVPTSSPTAMKSYLKKLEILMKLKTDRSPVLC